MSAALVLDFTRRARAAVVDRRGSCTHDWRARGQVEVCSSCRAQFPCHGFACTHLDCIERGIALGRRGFPRAFPLAVSIPRDGHTHPATDCPCADLDPDSHYLLRVVPSDPPETWTLPDGWSLS